MKPYESQIEMAKEGYKILKANGIVYLAAEERTGKTITSLLIADECKGIKHVLVLTKKKALEHVDEETGEKSGWQPTLQKCASWLKARYTATNYHQASKLKDEYDLVILDEAHSYIAASPTRSAIWKAVKKLTKNKPIIFMSATPHAQGRQQLFHQFALSDWSPWRRYKTFYAWFKVYGIPDSIWVNSQPRPIYTKVKDQMVREDVDHLFITKTRKELGFAHEPVDRLHYIALSEDTKALYNAIVNDRIAEINGMTLVCDSPMKLRTSLHMLEGGVAKIDNTYITLDNQEKIDYIKQTWGDTNQIVIFYQYIQEGVKLKEHFKHAVILQGTSFAEGVDLSGKDTLVIYSQDFSTARHSQRRARQANFNRDTAITVHYLLCSNKAISEQVYTCVSVNKTNFVDSVFERATL